MEKKRARPYSPSEVKAMREAKNKYVASLPEGKRITLNELSDHIQKTLFPARSRYSVQAALQRHRLWKPTYYKPNPGPRPQGARVVKAIECPACGHLIPLKEE